MDLAPPYQGEIGKGALAQPSASPVRNVTRAELPCSARLSIVEEGQLRSSSAPFRTDVQTV
jgi:hypothetical protein